MANLCKNTLVITEYKDENLEEIKEYLHKGNEEFIELMKTEMPEFRIYEEDFGKAKCSDSENNITIEFFSAWGGNPAGVPALSSLDIFKDCKVEYSRKIEGDSEIAVWKFLNGKTDKNASDNESNNEISEEERETEYEKSTRLSKLSFALSILADKGSRLIEEIEENDIDISEYESEILNFEVYHQQYEVLTETREGYLEDSIVTLNDVNMAGLSGVDDESDLDFDPNEELNTDFFITWYEDITELMKESVDAMEKSIEEN